MNAPSKIKLIAKSIKLLRGNQMSELQYFSQVSEALKKISERTRKANQISYWKHQERNIAYAKAKRSANKLIPEKVEAYRKYTRERARIKVKTDVIFVLRKRMRGRLIEALKRHEVSKKNGTEDLIGCTIAQLKIHIESQFKPGMNWDNHGIRGWHVDHIRPCASFDLTDLEQQRQCFHYTNLQPLWWHENLSKGPRKK